MGGLSGSEWVFGYASLVPDGAGGGAVEAELAGLPAGARRGARQPPHHPRLQDLHAAPDGSRPDVYVAFFDLEAADAMTVAGLALPVDESRLAALDAREANYERVDVTGLVEGVSGRVWTYMGRGTESRARLARGLAEGTAVVSQDYLEKVHAAFRARGKEAYARLRAHHGDPRDPGHGPGPPRRAAAGERVSAPPGTTWSARPTAPTCRCGVSWRTSAAGRCWTWAPAPAGWRWTWPRAATRWSPWTWSPSWWTPVPSAPLPAPFP